MGDNRWESTLSAVRRRASEWRQRARSALGGAPSTSSEPEPEEVPTQAPGSPLYQHTVHQHVPRNVNQIHHREQQTASFNTLVAVWLTKNTGTMQCAYIFAGIGIGSLIGVFTNNVVLAAVFGSLSSYFLQLVLLPILSVGQGVLGRHAELQAEEMFKTTKRSFHDIEEIMAHLSSQDEELLKHTKLLLQLCGQPVPEAQPAVVAAGVTPAVETASSTPAERPARATAAARVRRSSQP